MIAPPSSSQAPRDASRQDWFSKTEFEEITTCSHWLARLGKSPGFPDCRMMLHPTISTIPSQSPKSIGLHVFLSMRGCPLFFIPLIKSAALEVLETFEGFESFDGDNEGDNGHLR